MRTFGRVETSIWQNWRFNQFSDDEKLLWLYLITQPNGRAPTETTASNMRWTLDRIRAACASGGAAHQSADEVVIVDAFGSKPPRRAPGERLAWHAWTIIRDAIFERDGRTCRYCGTSDGPLEIDHIKPLARGGTDDDANLAVACRHCNRSKRDRLDWTFGRAG